MYLGTCYVETSLVTKLTIVIASLESIVDCGYLVLGILRQPLREIDTRLAVRRRPLGARLAPSGLLAVVASSCHGTQHEARLPPRQCQTQPLPPMLPKYKSRPVEKIRQGTPPRDHFHLPKEIQ